MTGFDWAAYYDRVEKALAALEPPHDHDAMSSRMVCGACNGMHYYCATCGERLDDCA